MMTSNRKQYQSPTVCQLACLTSGDTLMSGFIPMSCSNKEYQGTFSAPIRICTSVYE